LSYTLTVPDSSASSRVGLRSDIRIQFMMPACVPWRSVIARLPCAEHGVGQLGGVTRGSPVWNPHPCHDVVPVHVPKLRGPLGRLRIKGFGAPQTDLDIALSFAEHLQPLRARDFALLHSYSL